MIRLPPAVLLLALLLGACGPDPTGSDAGARVRPETDGLRKAVALALPELDRARRGDEPVQLVRAERMVLEGRSIWRMTFKPTHLIPEDPAQDMWGMGGEVFVNVDLDGGTTTHAYGE